MKRHNCTNFLKVWNEFSKIAVSDKDGTVLDIVLENDRMTTGTSLFLVEYNFAHSVKSCYNPRHLMPRVLDKHFEQLFRNPEFYVVDETTDGVLFFKDLINSDPSERLDFTLSIDKDKDRVRRTDYIIDTMRRGKYEGNGGFTVNPKVLNSVLCLYSKFGFSRVNFTMFGDHSRTGRILNLIGEKRTNCGIMVEQMTAYIATMR